MCMQAIARSHKHPEALQLKHEALCKADEALLVILTPRVSTRKQSIKQQPCASADLVQLLASLEAG